jgi:Holliday junction resolvasome RuvABC endonuclease subunit
MIVLGLDPSFRNFGVTVCKITGMASDPVIEVLELHLFETQSRATKGVRKNSDDLRCVRELVAKVDELIKLHEPKVVMCEVPVGSQSARASWTLGATLGVLGSIATPMIEVTPREVKEATVGHNKATKEEMIDWVVTNHPEAEPMWFTRKLRGEMVMMNKNEHVADAVSTIHAGIKSEQFRMAMRMR